MGFENGAHLADQVERRARAYSLIGLQVVDVCGRPALAGALKVHGHDLRALRTVIDEGEGDPLGRRGLVPNLLEEGGVV